MSDKQEIQPIWAGDIGEQVVLLKDHLAAVEKVEERLVASDETAHTYQTKYKLMKGERDALQARVDELELKDHEAAQEAEIERLRGLLETADGFLGSGYTPPSDLRMAIQEALQQKEKE